MAKAGKRRKATRKARAVKGLKIVYVPLDKLKLWDQNPRDNDEAAEKLAKIIRRHGFIDPVVATRDGLIRAGNTRYKAAKKAKLAEVPVIYVDFGSEEEAQLYSLADNKANEYANWNTGLLRELFGQLRSLGEKALAEGSGFSRLELEGIGTKLSGVAAQTFAEAVEEFEKLNPEVTEKQLWVWMVVPEKRKVFDALVKKYGTTKAKTGHRSVKRELDWDKVRVLFISTLSQKTRARRQR